MNIESLCLSLEEAIIHIFLQFDEKELMSFYYKNKAEFKLLGDIILPTSFHKKYSKIIKAYKDYFSHELSILQQEQIEYLEGDLREQNKKINELALELSTLKDMLTSHIHTAHSGQESSVTLAGNEGEEAVEQGDS